MHAKAKIMYFIGSVKLELLVQPGEDRKAKLLEDFTYVDSEGDKWTAKKGAIVDGASIPRAFWSLIGGPFDGDYRNASIIHDYYCKKKLRPSSEVHECFCEMMLVLEVPFWKRKIMCFAVKTFGPKFGAKDGKYAE